MDIEIMLEGTKLMVTYEVNTDNEPENVCVWAGDSEIYYLLAPQWQAKVDEYVWNAIRDGAERWCEMHEDAQIDPNGECA